MASPLHAKQEPRNWQSAIRLYTCRAARQAMHFCCSAKPNNKTLNVCGAHPTCSRIWRLSISRTFTPTQPSNNVTTDCAHPGLAYLHWNRIDRVTDIFVLLKHYCLWSPYVIGQTIIFLPCDFFLLLSSSSSFFSSPNLSGRRLDVYHTSTHGVALVRI